MVAFLTTRMRSVICTSSPALGLWEFPYWEVKLTWVLLECATKCHRQSPCPAPPRPEQVSPAGHTLQTPHGTIVPGLAKAPALAGFPSERLGF